ncbi:hypothetical protein ACFSQU_18210 [Massilia sp. GCM10020059]|uniref:Uncharacterized protein n=1 Tax=Massilia agrisoli TaxID=2892444 RepID=A0ABS8IS56_9BURK|nr:hypothetical protein [Massilia agrisoli]MCC6071477.1 hypothetical protein [Massilia agrisoli]
MYTIQPATIANDLHVKLVSALVSSSHYLSTSSGAFVRFSDELDTLGKVDAVSRSLLLVLLYTMAGDRERCEYYLDNAQRLHADKDHVELARLTMLLNLGYFSEAIPFISMLRPPQFGLPTLLMLKPPCNGAFHTLTSLFDQAAKMNLLNGPTEPVSLRPATAIMDEWGDTDEDYAAALDIAGAIMREHRLVFVDDIQVETVLQPADGSPSYVKLCYQVDVDLDTSIELTLEYADRLAQSGKKIPPSLVFEFEGARH